MFIKGGIVYYKGFDIQVSLSSLFPSSAMNLVFVLIMYAYHLLLAFVFGFNMLCDFYQKEK